MKNPEIKVNKNTPVALSKQTNQLSPGTALFNTFCQYEVYEFCHCDIAGNPFLFKKKKEINKQRNKQKRAKKETMLSCP